MLTPKQEKYVQNLIKGMSQREAYKNSYNAKNMKDTTIDKKACELLKKDNIRGRYDELIKELKDDAIMDAKERMIWLSRVIKGNEKEKYTYYKDDEECEQEREADISTKIKALDTLNKMSGEYSQNVKLSGNVHVQEQKNAIDDIVAQMKPLTEDDV